MNNKWLVAILSALLLGSVQSGVAAESPASGDAKQPADQPVDSATIAATLAEIHDVDHFAKLASTSTGDAADPMAQAFMKWAVVLTRLSRAGQTEDADRICAAIVELHDRLPEKAVISPGHAPANAFIRDRFRVGDLAVDVAQFFSPERYYKDDPAIVKLYRFSVYKGKDVVLRYYLERSHLEEDYYVLGKSDPKTGAHYQVQPYGARQPTYWTLLQRVLVDMSDPAPKYPASSHPQHP